METRAAYTLKGGEYQNLAYEMAKSRFIKKPRRERARDYMDQMAEDLGGACYICKEPYKTSKGKRRPGMAFTIHHLYYKADDKTWKDFNTRLQYWKYLQPLVHVEKEDQFILLCRSHHKAVEIMARWSRANFGRLYNAVELTRKGGGSG